MHWEVTTHSKFAPIESICVKGNLDFIFWCLCPVVYSSLEDWKYKGSITRDCVPQSHCSLPADEAQMILYFSLCTARTNEMCVTYWELELVVMWYWKWEVCVCKLQIAKKLPPSCRQPPDDVRPHWLTFGELSCHKSLYTVSDLMIIAGEPVFQISTIVIMDKNTILNGSDRHSAHWRD